MTRDMSRARIFCGGIRRDGFPVQEEKGREELFPQVAMPLVTGLCGKRSGETGVLSENRKAIWEYS